jgi:hypothetical protein
MDDAQEGAAAAPDQLGQVTFSSQTDALDSGAEDFVSKDLESTLQLAPAALESAARTSPSA